MGRNGWIETLGGFLSGYGRVPAPPVEASARVVDVPGHGRLVADACLDLMGETCLRTNLLTKRALDGAPAGTVIEIALDNMSSVETIPFMLPGHGWVHLVTVHEDGNWKIYARKRE